MTDIREAARELGFDRVYFLKPVYAPRREIHALNEHVADDPETLLAGVKTVILLIKAYVRYEATQGATVSAYYIASQQAYMNAKKLCDALRADGFRAVSNAQIAVKPFMEAHGIGVKGRNSLIRMAGIGSRFHVQVILTDAQMPYDEASAEELPSCGACRACVRACPTRAISEDGRVDITRCLRARGEGEVIPEEMRHLYENRLLGCEICQDVCPANAAGKTEKMSKELEEACDLKALLRGEVSALKPLIGANYARKTRIRMKAAVVAGNLLREDCVEELEQMERFGTDGEKIHARWALENIRRGKA